MRTLTLLPLEQNAFAPFGEVISVGEKQGKSANQNTATRFDFCAQLENKREHAKANLAVFQSRMVTLPFTMRLFEKHPHSSQTFLPLKCARYVVCVAPTMNDGAPDSTRALAFYGVSGQGVHYAAGVWHHPILAIESGAEFAMLAWEDGSSLDCVEFALEASLKIDF